MIKKILWLFFIITLALSACGTLNVTIDHNPAPAAALPAAPTDASPSGIQPGPTLALPDQSLNMDSTSDAIRQKMLTSALNWKTI
jgi:hypothetical protein